MLSGSSPTPASRTATRTCCATSRFLSITSSRGRSATVPMASSPVEDEVEHDLLQLNSIADDPWEIAGEVGSQRHARSPHLALGERHYLGDGFVEAEWFLLGNALLRHASYSCDHLARPLAVANDALYGFARLAHVRGIARHPSETGVAVDHHARERLVHLVGDRRRHLTHGRDPCDVRELRLHLAQIVLGSSAVGGVDHYRREKRYAPRNRRHQEAADVSPDHGAVLAPEALLEAHRRVR